MQQKTHKTKAKEEEKCDKNWKIFSMRKSKRKGGSVCVCVCVSAYVCATAWREKYTTIKHVFFMPTPPTPTPFLGSVCVCVCFCAACSCFYFKELKCVTLLACGSGGWEGVAKIGIKNPLQLTSVCVCVCAWVGVSVCKWWLGADILLLWVSQVRKPKQKPNSNLNPWVPDIAFFNATVIL